MSDPELTHWEKSLAELESIVKEFESNSLTLEHGLAQFERGVQLYKQCKGALKEVEKRVKILTEELQEEDFES